MLRNILMIIWLAMAGINALSAQALSPDEIGKIPRDLFREGVLSKEGRKAFEHYIEGKEIPVFKEIEQEKKENQPYYRSLFPQEDSSLSETLPHSRTALLGFFVGIENTMNQGIQGYGFPDPERVMQGLKGLMGNVWLGLYELEYLDPYEEEDKALLDRQLRSMAYPLRVAGLLDKRVYQDLIRRLEGRHMLPGHSFFQYLQTRTLFYENYPERKAEQLAYVQRLTDAGIFTPEGQDELNRSYLPFEVKNELELLQYCQEAVVLEAMELPREPAEAYEKVLFTIQKHLFPDVAFSHFESKPSLIRDEDGDFYETEVVSLRIDSFAYEQVLSFDPGNFDFEPYGSPFFLSQVSEWDFKLVNDYLDDAGSKKRLFVLEDRPVLSLEPMGSRIGFVLLDSAQVAAWNSSLYFSVLPSPFTTKGPLNRSEIFTFLQLLDSAGISPGLSSEQKEQLLIEVRRNGYPQEQNILEAIPGLVANIAWFQIIQPDAEEATYSRVLDLLQGISHSAFLPEERFDNLKAVLTETDSVLRYGFSFQGLRFESSQKLDYPYQALDTDFLPLVNQALEATGQEGRFYPLKVQSGRKLIYLTFQQLAFFYQRFPGLLAER